MACRRWVVTMAALGTATVIGCGRLGFDGLGGGDAPPAGAVAVTTYGQDPGEGPVAGAVVWSSHADGTVDDVVSSSAIGTASLHVDAGGAVTAAYPGPPYHLHTVFDVAPGDALRFGTNVPLCDQTPRGTVTVTWTAVNGAMAYRFGTGCNQVVATAVTTSVPWAITGAVPDPFDLVVRAEDGFGNAIKTATVLAASTAAGATIAITDPDWITPPFVPVGLSGFPARFNLGDLIVSYRTPASRDSPGSDGLYTVPITGGTIELNAPIAAGVDRLSVSADGIDDPAGVVLQSRRLFVAPFPPTLVVPIGDPPMIADNIAYDVGARRFTWTGAGTAEGVHAVFVIRAQTMVDLVWSGWAPGGRTELVLPEPPPGVVTSVPGDASTVIVQTVDITGTPPWAELRQRGEWEVPLDPSSDEDVITAYSAREQGAVTPP